MTSVRGLFHLPVLLCSLAVSFGLLVTSSCSSHGGVPTTGKKFSFHGTVVSVDPKDKLANIKGDKVEGWMEAMTMDYPVPETVDLNKLKPGLTFRAVLVISGDDYSLHDVQPAQ